MGLGGRRIARKNWNHVSRGAPLNEAQSGDYQPIKCGEGIWEGRVDLDGAEQQIEKARICGQANSLYGHKMFLVTPPAFPGAAFLLLFGM